MLPPLRLLAGVLALSLASALWFPAARAAGSGPVLAPMPGLERSFPEDGVRFTNRIEGGRLHAVERVAPLRYRLEIRSESEPVHHSPWYAFAVDLDAPARVEIQLDYPQSRHRYPPRLSRDGVEWTAAADAGSAVTAPGSGVHTLALAAGRTFVAAQEFIPLARIDAWLATLAARAGGELASAGTSVTGRPLPAWVLPPEPGARWIVVLGGQHPAEVPGHLGLLAFGSRLAALRAEGALRHGIVVLPVLNPDGWAGGHWRHNARGHDLNRTWRSDRFEPETAAATAFLTDTIAGAPVALFVDFHATGRDVFYTFPDEMEGGPSGLKRRWLDDIAQRVPAFHVVENTAHNPGLAVSRLWARENLRCPALTFEFGDFTDRALLRLVAEAAADSLADLLRAQP